MKNSYGNQIILTVFGESHGRCVGAVLDGIPAGIFVDEDKIRHQLLLRAPLAGIGTSRTEPDDFVIESGVANGMTTGSPILIRIPNVDYDDKEYDTTLNCPRPGHSDYAAFCRNGTILPGGGHFSGRVTAGIVACGAILLDMLTKNGIVIGSHVLSCAALRDPVPADYLDLLPELNKKRFPVFDGEISDKMQSTIKTAAENGDSVGACIETFISGVPAGVGEPFFDSLEGTLSHAAFAIPGIKGVSFGDGFDFCEMYGSACADQLRVEDGKIVPSDHNGGINGGLSNGGVIVMRSAVKPTPTIAQETKTVNLSDYNNVNVRYEGRHDPCIAPRARVVIDSLCALVICDALCSRFGSAYFEER